MTTQAFDFEQPIVDQEEKLKELRARSEDGDEQARADLEAGEAELTRIKEEVYAGLTPWQRVLFARHKDRPRAPDFIAGLCTEFIELHGDRNFGDDQAVITGTARFRGQAVAVIGQAKGKDTRENVTRNFGMMHPEGYRKALRVMRLAHKFKMPILIFVDTPGAYPGLGAEERGQAEAIAYNIQEMMGLEVPIVMTVIGEGASGGALGVGLADRVLMLENAWYCVISPEGCAAILFRDASHAPRAAEVLKLTASDLLDLGVIDEIIPEPLGGAHRHPQQAFANVGDAIEKNLKDLGALKLEKLIDERFEKFRRMGTYRELE
ncbi:MAG: acetyl-CoA carboxylase carboxyltransferase subunit alpha [Sumerlaeia bacterium]